MAEIQNKPLYKDFLNYTYSELEEMLSKAEDKNEKDFYASLCQLYIKRRQKKIMEEKPF